MAKIVWWCDIHILISMFGCNASRDDSCISQLPANSISASLPPSGRVPLGWLRAWILLFSLRPITPKEALRKLRLVKWPSSSGGQRTTWPSYEERGVKSVHSVCRYWNVWYTVSCDYHACMQVFEYVTVGAGARGGLHMQCCSLKILWLYINAWYRS